MSVNLLLYGGNLGDDFFRAIEGGGYAAKGGEDAADVVVEKGVRVGFGDGEGISEFGDSGEVGCVFHELEATEVAEGGMVRVREVCRIRRLAKRDHTDMYE